MPAVLLLGVWFATLRWLVYVVAWACVAAVWVTLTVVRGIVAVVVAAARQRSA
jgi:hypothetical protein